MKHSAISDKDSTMDPGWTSLPVEELDALRAENQQLHAVAKVHLETGRTLAAQNERLLERYHRANNYAAELETELDALRAQLEQARELYVAMLAELNDLRAENRRLRAERDDAIDAEKIALREIGAENERLRAALERVNYLLETDNAVQMAWSKDIRAVLGPPPAQDT